MVRPAKPVAARRRPGATRPFDTTAVITAAILVAALAVGGNQWFLQADLAEPDAKTSVMKARTGGEITHAPIVNSPSAPSAAPGIPALRQSSSMSHGPMLRAFLAYNEASENYKQDRKLEAVEQCEIIIDALGDHALSTSEHL